MEETLPLHEGNSIYLLLNFPMRGVQPLCAVDVIRMMSLLALQKLILSFWPVADLVITVGCGLWRVNGYIFLVFVCGTAVGTVDRNANFPLLLSFCFVAMEFTR